MSGALCVADCAPHGAPVSAADSQQGTKGPRKKKRAGGGSGAPARPVADQPPPQRPPTMGEGSCPVAGCDSRGHLSGLYERHFTRMACPLYHRTTDTQAKVPKAWPNVHPRRSVT